MLWHPLGGEWRKGGVDVEKGRCSFAWGASLDEAKDSEESVISRRDE